MTTVLDFPALFDFFTLDGDRSPGIVEIAGGGEREFDIVDQAQPLTAGANTVQRRQNNMVTTYGFRLWLPEHFAKRDVWRKMFAEGAKRLPNPRAYRINDENVPDMRRCLIQKWGPQKPKAPGGPWDWMVMVHEYNRVQPFGGPALPPDALDAKLDALRKQVQTEEQKLATAQAARSGRAAARAGK